MLIINTIKGASISYHVDVIPEEVTGVYADCTELEHIIHTFDNLPRNIKDPFVKWCNPWAQFIVDNLKW